MNSICIYYIATSTYKNYFNGFYDSINNFFPEAHKHIVYINDDKDFDTIQYNKDNISLEHIYIPHMPWPLVALMKHWWIINNKREGYGAYFYFNANDLILPMSDICKNSITDAIDNNKLIATYHGGYIHQSEDTLKYLASIKDNNINNIQSGFFGSVYDVFYGISEKSYKYVEDALLQNKIPEWHDETAYDAVIWDDFINNKICIHLYHSVKITGNPYQFILLRKNYFKVRKKRQFNFKLQDL